MKILFGQIIFVGKYYTVLYTWHDHWAEVWVKEMKYIRWSCVDFKEHLKNIERKPTQNKKSNNAKVFVKPHFIMIYHHKCCAMKIRV